MDWDAIGAIGEIVGAGAVVLSLIYLGTQIRTQNAETRAAARRDFGTGLRESYLTFTEPEMAEIWVKAKADFDTLTDPEKLRLLGGLVVVLKVFEEAFDRKNEGVLPAQSWEAVNRQYTSLMAAPVYQRLWQLRRHYFHEEFQKYVDELEPSAFNLF